MSMNVTAATITHTVRQAPASYGTVAQPVATKVIVRPRMYGNDMFFVPERVAVNEQGRPATPEEGPCNPLRQLFNWFFGE